MHFKLDPRLAKDTLFVTDLALCQVRLMNDANYPWCVLIPRVNDVSELSDLSHQDYLSMQAESLRLCQLMQNLFTPDKMNVATLGNIVPQLHVHHIARFSSDPAWPNPVWGSVPAQAYNDKHREKVLRLLSEGLAQPLT